VIPLNAVVLLKPWLLIRWVRHLRGFFASDALDMFFRIIGLFFGKSSKRLENWILSHPRFGFTVMAWRKRVYLESSSLQKANLIIDLVK
jgi:uncharacterized membrane protein YbaN (DUF454 family)